MPPRHPLARVNAQLDPELAGLRRRMQQHQPVNVTLIYGDLATPRKIKPWGGQQISDVGS